MIFHLKVIEENVSHISSNTYIHLFYNTNIGTNRFKDTGTLQHNTNVAKRKTQTTSGLYIIAVIVLYLTSSSTDWYSFSASATAAA